MYEIQMKGEILMYDETVIQTSFNDFNMGFGIELDTENRWEYLELEYEKHFPSKKGNRAKPFRMAFGALIIQQELGTSDEETVQHIQENVYLQYFIGLQTFQQKAPFDPSLMVRFRKRIDMDTILQSNEKLIEMYSHLFERQSDPEPLEEESDQDNGGSTRLSSGSSTNRT